MNRTSIRRHKPRRSDDTFESNDSRCKDAKDCSDESSDDDDDDEEHSTDRDTEDTEEGSVDNRREWEALAKYLRSQRAYIERNQPGSFDKTSGVKKEKKDKTTQKNLTSPMPSIWKPPIYKEISAAPGFKVIKSKVVNEKESDFEDVMLRYITKLQTNTNVYRNENKNSCPHKPSPGERIKKFCSRHRKQPEQKSKKCRRECKHTCIEMALPNPVGTLPQLDSTKKRGKDMKTHSQCNLPFRFPPAENLKKSSEDSAKVKEKLVYVVEEEGGKSVAKMETDLFSVNEILTIKKDLMELSEFAKKLKRLKEIRMETEKEKSCGANCQCKPVAELLRDVNKRMEALEARQEELERGIQKGRETETDTKKSDDTKTSSVSPPLGTVKPEPSAVKSISSFEKTELTNISREGEGGAFSKNLEIVNELLDIKSQLQKLEKKRMSKELSPEIGPTGYMKPKGKERAINVFSSKTYILTADAYNKKNNNKDTHAGEKYSSPDPSMKEKPSVSLERQQVKDTVADWLKNITTSQEKPNGNQKVFMASKSPIENESIPEEICGLGTTSKEKKRSRNLEGEEFENQEPQKNRAKDTGAHETNHARQKPSREHSWYKEHRLESEASPFRERPRGKLNKDVPIDRYPMRIPPAEREKMARKPRQVASTSSIPSAVLVKEQIQRLRHSGSNPNRTYIVKPSRSKSVQEFSSVSCLSKDEKMVFNMSRKNRETKLARKREKEKENEQVQGELGTYKRSPKHVKELAPIRSQLVASVNLEQGSMSLSKDQSGGANCPLPLFPFSISPDEVFKILEFCKEEDNKIKRESWCRRPDRDHKPRKCSREKDKLKSCINKCYRKKTKVKCSRNHCCNKKAKRPSSRSSRCRSQRDPFSSSDPNQCCCEGRKHKRKCCYVNKYSPRKTCVVDTPSSVSCTENKEQEGEEEGEEEEDEDQTSSVSFRKTEGYRCRSKKPKATCRKKAEKCPDRKPYTCQIKKDCRPSCQIQETSKTTTGDETSKTEEVQSIQKPTKSSLKDTENCRPRIQTRMFHEDPCYIASFWKNLRKFYPRFSTLQLMSWLKLYCQQEKEKECKGATLNRDQSYRCTDCQRKVQPCKCYRMSTIRGKRPVVSSSSELSEDSITEAETQSTNTDSTETDFMFPYRKPKTYYAYTATTEDETEESEENKKVMNKNNETTTGSGDSSTDEKSCRCQACGHVHKKKKKKVKYKEDTASAHESTDRSKKYRMKSGKLKSSIISKLGEVRQLRVCEGKLKCPRLRFRKSKTDCSCLSGDTKDSKCSCGKREKNKETGKTAGGCHCELILADLENRIATLERENKDHKKLVSDEDTSQKHENASETTHDEEKTKEDTEKKSKRKDDRYHSPEKGSGEDEHKEKKKKKEEHSADESDHCKTKKEKKKKKKKKEHSADESDHCETRKERKKKKKKKKEHSADESDHCETRKEKKKKKKRQKKEHSADESDHCETRKERKKKKKQKKEHSADESDHCETRKERKKKKKQEKEHSADESDHCETKKQKKKKKREHSAEESDHCEKKKQKKKKKKEHSAEESDHCETKKHKKKKKKKGHCETKKEKTDSNEERHSEEETGKKKKAESPPVENDHSETKREKVKKTCSNENCHCKEVFEKDQNNKKEKESKESEVATHYCRCKMKNLSKEESSTGQTATPSEKSSFRQKMNFSLEALRKKKQAMLEKLSLSFFWRNFWGRRGADEDVLLDDASRSSEVPRFRSIRPVDNEPSFLSQRKKRKKEKKTKEKRVPKTKSRSRRTIY